MNHLITSIFILFFVFCSFSQVRISGKFYQHKNSLIYAKNDSVLIAHSIGSYLGGHLYLPNVYLSDTLRLKTNETFFGKHSNAILKEKQLIFYPKTKKKHSVKAQEIEAEVGNSILNKAYLTENFGKEVEGPVLKHYPNALISIHFPLILFEKLENQTIPFQEFRPFVAEKILEIKDSLMLKNAEILAYSNSLCEKIIAKNFLAYKDSLFVLLSDNMASDNDFYFKKNVNELVEISPDLFLKLIEDNAKFRFELIDHSNTKNKSNTEKIKAVEGYEKGKYFYFKR